MGKYINLDDSCLTESEKVQLRDMIYKSSFSSEKTERPPEVQNFSHKLTTTYKCINQQGKMILYFLTIILIPHVSNISTMDIDSGNLPNNVLKFGHGINYKYMG